jgi:hypothetical protein
MAACGKCGKKATVAYNRVFHVIPFDRRIYCEHCFDKTLRREDILLLGSLFGIFFAVVAAILAIHFAGKSELAKSAEQIEAYYDENDLNKDGRVDFWESTATPEMKTNLTNYGYPWKKVLGANSASSQLSFMIDRDVVLRLSTERKFTELFNFPGLMKSHFEGMTSDASLKQLSRAFVTSDNEVVLLVKTYEKAPEGGFSAMFSGPVENRLGPLNTEMFVEALLESRIREMFGLDDGTCKVTKQHLICTKK